MRSDQLREGFHFAEKEPKLLDSLRCAVHSERSHDAAFVEGFRSINECLMPARGSAPSPRRGQQLQAGSWARLVVEKFPRVRAIESADLDALKQFLREHSQIDAVPGVRLRLQGLPVCCAPADPAPHGA